jgi:hypothetical protein
LAPLAWSLFGGAMWAGTIVGFDRSDFALPNSLFSIDPQSGAVAVIGAGNGVALSQGPVGGTILYSVGLNVIELNVGTGQSRAYLCPGGHCGPISDHAYDSSTGAIYALSQLYPLGLGFPNPITGLLRLYDTGVPFPGVPDSTQIGYGLVGPLGVEGITTIEYVPGYGLIGTDGYHALYRISEVSGQASLLAPLSIVLPVAGGITPMNGLAYDGDTGRLLGSAPYGQGDPGIGLARIYVIDFRIDPNSNVLFATASWLNESPPNLTGIAAVNGVPEPGAMLLVGMGLVAMAMAGRRGGFRAVRRGRRTRGNG